MGKAFSQVWIPAVALVAALAGCGGNGSRSVARNASMSYAVEWPARTRSLPTAAESAVVKVSFGNRVVASHVFNRPAGSDAGSNDSFVFAGLPAGSVKVTLEAFTEAGGQGDGLGTTVATPTLEPGKTATVAAAIDTTPTQLTIDSESVPLFKGGLLPILLTARDAKGYLVPIKPEDVTWSSGDTDVVTVGLPPTGGVALGGVSEGTATVTATYKGLSATFSATVKPVLKGSVKFTMPWTFGATPAPASWVSVVVKAENGVDEPVKVTIGRPSDLTTPSVQSLSGLKAGSYNLSYAVFDGPEGSGGVVFQDVAALDVVGGNEYPFTFGGAPFALAPVSVDFYAYGSLAPAQLMYQGPDPLQLHLTVTLSDGTQKDVTNAATWSSDGYKFAVSSTGLVNRLPTMWSNSLITANYKGTDYKIRVFGN